MLEILRRLFFLQLSGGLLCVLFCTFPVFAVEVSGSSAEKGGEIKQVEEADPFSSFLKQLFSGTDDTTSGTNVLSLDSAQKPRYRPGTTFIYSNGSWEKVVAADTENVTWENHRGYVSSGRADIIYRRTKWQTRAAKGAREFVPAKFLLEESASSLWPLKVGNEISFYEKGRWQPKGKLENIYSTYWQCMVEGTEKVSVPAGEFDTWKVSCSRFVSPEKAHLGKVREMKTYYYAPELEHWVIEIKDYRYRKPTRRRELVAVLPGLQDIEPVVDLAALNRSFQKALESNTSGTPLVWQSKKAGVSSTVTPRKTFKLKNGTYCRRYEQEIKTPSLQDVYYGVACRDAQGVWATPRR